MDFAQSYESYMLESLKRPTKVKAHDNLEMEQGFFQDQSETQRQYQGNLLSI